MDSLVELRRKYAQVAPHLSSPTYQPSEGVGPGRSHIVSVAREVSQDCATNLAKGAHVNELRLEVSEK
jgi:hypothetical protein